MGVWILLLSGVALLMAGLTLGDWMYQTEEGHEWLNREETPLWLGYVPFVASGLGAILPVAALIWAGVNHGTL